MQFFRYGNRSESIQAILEQVILPTHRERKILPIKNALKNHNGIHVAHAQPA